MSSVIGDPPSRYGNRSGRISRKRHWLKWLFATVVVSVFSTPSFAGIFLPDSPDDTPPDRPGPTQIIGKVETVPGVAQTKCRVVVVGIPKGSSCNKTGFFDLRGMPASVAWELKIYLPYTDQFGIDHYDYDASGNAIKSSYTTLVGGDAYEVADAGTLVVSQPGMVAGRLNLSNKDHNAAAVVSVKGFPIAVKPNNKGYYLLTDVPPGEREIVVFDAIDGTEVSKTVAVVPNEITKDVNFTMSVYVDPDTAINNYTNQSNYWNDGAFNYW